MMKIKKYVLFTLLILFILLPIYSDYIIGPFHWHISIWPFWRDAAEMFIYMMSITLTGLISKKLRFFAIIFWGSLYLISIGTFLQVLISYFFIEIILFIGRTVNRLLLSDKFGFGVDFLMGTIVLGTSYIVLSLLGLGTIDDLRICTIILVFICFCVSINHIEINNFMCVRFSQYVNGLSRKEFGIILILVFSFLLSFARINTHLEYDSSWYALYTDKNLFGGKSFYDFLGYTGFIYYYPKFKELLFAPLSGLKIAGYLIAPNLWIMIIMIHESYRYIKNKLYKVNKMEENIVLLIVALIYTTMAICGIAGTAKSDTLSFVYVLISWIYFDKFMENKSLKCLAISLSAGIMSYTVKYTSYLWTTILLIVFCVSILRVLLKKTFLITESGCCDTNQEGARIWKWREWLILLFSLFILFGILYRTYLITGLPFGREGLAFLKRIGFKGKDLFNFDENSTFPSVFLPERMVNFFFLVGKAEKVTAQWIGNYWVFFSLCVITLIPLRKYAMHIKTNLWKFGVIGLFTVVGFYLMITMYAPDGNYFSMMIIFIATEVCLILFSFLENELARFVKVCCLLFCILNCCLNFTVDCAWGCATRFSFDDIKLVTTQEDNLKWLDNLMKSNGIYKINSYLEENEKDSYIILDSEVSTLTCLDARIEMAEDFSSTYLSAVYPQTMEEFLNYIDQVNLKGFILANDQTGNQLFEKWAYEFLNTYGWIMSVEDENYTYYKIR